MDNVITGTRSALIQDNVKLESVLTNIRNAPNETAGIADTKSQISDSSRYNFNSEHSMRLIDNINNENNAILGTKVDKQEFPSQFSGNNVQEVNFFNQQDSEINKNTLSIANMKSEVVDFKLGNSEGDKEFKKNIDGIIPNSQEGEFNKHLCSFISNSVDDKSRIPDLNENFPEVDFCNSMNQINSIYTNKKNEVSESHVSKVYPYPYALSDCNMDTADTTGRNIHNIIVCKMECDESYATVDERSCSSVDFPALSTAHSEPNVSITQYNKLYNKSKEIFTRLELDEGLSIIKEVKMLSPKKYKNILDSSLRNNALNCTTANGSLTEKLSLSSSTTVNKILCSDKPNWSIGIRSASGNIKTEKSADSEIPNSDVSKYVNDISSISLNIKTENSADSEIPNSDVSKYVNDISSVSLNIKTEKSADSEIPNSDVSKYVNDISSVSLNIKTEKSADSEIPNSDVSKYVNDISSVSLNIKTEKSADSEIPNCNIEKLSTADSPILLNIKTETSAKREILNCDISKYYITGNLSNSLNIKTEKTADAVILNHDILKYCSSNIPSVSVNIKSEKTEYSEIQNCDIPKYCSIHIPSSLNIKTEASSSTVSNKDCSEKIFENSSTAISNKCGQNGKQNSIDSFINFQTTSKESELTSCVRTFSEIGSHRVVFDKEPKPSTSKVSILSTIPKSTLTTMNTAPEDLNKIRITTSSNGNSSAEISPSSVIEGKFNDDSYKNKKFRTEDSELYQLLTCSQNNIFRIAGSSVCPVTKGRHIKLVLQSYKCHKCNETFFTEKQLELHQITHRSKYSLRSTICDKQFMNGKSHVRSVVQYEPETKDVKFLDNVQENIHRRQEGKVSILKISKLHSNIKNEMLPEEAVITYKCDQCNEKFRFKPNVQSLTVPQQHPVFQCSFCPKGSCACKSREEECFKSSNSESETDEPYDECHICGYKPWIPSRRTLREHMLIHSRPYKCGQCEKTFTSKRYVQSHQQQHINGDPVSCKICGKFYKNKSSLNSHSRTHKAKSLSEKCHLCDAKFCTLAQLKRHYMKHTGEKPYSCDICGKSFRMTNTLRKHLSIHSNDTYLCEICGKELRSAHHLARHRSVHLNGKQFKCKVCNKMFNYETNLAQHLLTHSDKRNYACKLCDKKFKRPHHLRQHEQTHF